VSAIAPPTPPGRLPDDGAHAAVERYRRTRNADAFVGAVDSTEVSMDRVPTLSLTGTTSRAAVGALRDLSSRAEPGNPMLHRVGHGDVLTAAIAAEHGFDVLHYDRHFDALATVLNFDSVWIATPGEF
jgi:hypothetical protein